MLFPPAPEVADGLHVRKLDERYGDAELDGFVDLVATVELGTVSEIVAWLDEQLDNVDTQFAAFSRRHCGNKAAFVKRARFLQTLRTLSQVRAAIVSMQPGANNESASASGYQAPSSYKAGQWPVVKKVIEAGVCNLNFYRACSPCNRDSETYKRIIERASPDFLACVAAGVPLAFKMEYVDGVPHTVLETVDACGVVRNPDGTTTVYTKKQAE